MTEPLIAVAVEEHGQLSPHAGRAVHWNVYVVSNGQPELVWSIHLSKTGSLHEWHVRGDGNRHPLHGVDIALCGSAGEGVARRLAERGTTLVATSESDPITAITAYLNSTLAPGLPHEEIECLDPEHRKAVSKN